MSIVPANFTEEQINNLFTEACSAHAAERFAEAESIYKQLLSYFPEAAVLHYNLGLVYYCLNDFSKALHQFSLAHNLQPDDIEIHFNLALCLKKNGDIPIAIAAFRQLLATSPDNIDSWYNLGGCYRDIHDYEQTAFCYNRVLELDPNYLPALNNLAYLYHRLGDIEQAKACYEKLLTLRPEDKAAQYMLDSLLGTPLECAPDEYVRKFFDGYADGFEESLVGRLEYDAPRQLALCLAKCPEAKPVYEHGIDLGCGTGLTGIAFKDRVTVLDGLDLSGNMLGQASEKGCYDALYQDSMSNFLQTTTDRYDLFLAADVFIYVGELREIFIAMKAVALSGALFCFSTENLESSGYSLQQTGRFAYSPEYIRNITDSTGWEVLRVEQTQLRKEREQWLAGRLWILRLI